MVFEHLLLSSNHVKLLYCAGYAGLFTSLFRIFLRFKVVAVCMTLQQLPGSDGIWRKKKVKIDKKNKCSVLKLSAYLFKMCQIRHI